LDLVAVKMMMRAIWITIFWMAGLLLQAAPQEVLDPAKMEQLLKEAADLQSSQPQAVAEKLAPLLSALRQQRQDGKLAADTARILQDALLLAARTQSMLLLSEEEITPLFREILVTNPRVDESTFNPREKAALQKIRQSETGHLLLQTTPAGAGVAYLGSEFGRTPSSFALIAGAYRFRLSLPGYLDKDLEVTIRSNEDANEALTLRKRVVDIPVAVNAPGASVTFNGRNAGSTQGYNAWLVNLPADVRRDFAAIVQGWKIDTATAGFIRLSEVPVGETVKVEIQAPCYESVNLQFSVADQDVDWEHPIVVREELRRVELKRDTGYMEVSSNPVGAEVWLDGVLQGTTPVGKDVCVGSHRVQVLHRAGQFVQETNIRRGQASRISGDLKPALAFLGIYERNEGKPVTPLTAEWEAAARRLSLRITDFSDPRIPPEEINSLRMKGALPIDSLLRVEDGISPTEVDTLIKRISASAGRADLLLAGLRANGKYVFRLYNTLHPIADAIELGDLSDSALDFLIAQINRTITAPARLMVPDTGVDLIDSPRGLVVLNATAAAASGKAALVPGARVKSVDQKTMTFGEFQAMLQTRKPGQTVTLGIQNKDAISNVPVTVRFAGAEYPWNAPEGLPNALMVVLKSLAERDPLSEEAKYAGLSIARSFMNNKEWRIALEFLMKANLEPNKSGVCPGSVLYYLGRCYEELGDRAQAEGYYTRARDYAEATLGYPGGPAVPPLADQRIQSLRKR
jgi:tetratricopeptide (TPR) repeat protein